MPRRSVLNDIDCQTAGIVGTAVSIPGVIPVVLDRTGYTELALYIREGSLTVPAGVVAEVEAILETDSDPAFSNPVLMKEYEVCPVKCVAYDNTDGTNGDGTGDYVGNGCVLIPLKCSDSSQRYVRATITTRGAGVVWAADTSTATWLMSGHPVRRGK